MSNWANRSKQAINNVTLTPVGSGGERIETFYKYVIPRSGTLRDNQKVLSVWQEFNGTYEGTLESDGKFGKNIVYKIKTPTGIVGIEKSGQLTKRLAKVEQGSAVLVRYEGKKAMEDGPYAGTEAHQFFVAAEKLKA